MPRKSNEALLTFHVKSWEKWNPKVKRPYYFRMSTHFFDDPKVAKLNASDIVLLVYIYATCADQQHHTCTTSTEHIRTRCRLRTDQIHTSAKRLEQFQLVRLVNFTENLSIGEDRIGKERRGEALENPAAAAPQKSAPQEQKTGDVFNRRKIGLDFQSRWAGLYPADFIQHTLMKADDWATQKGKDVGAGWFSTWLETDWKKQNETAPKRPSADVRTEWSEPFEQERGPEALARVRQMLGDIRSVSDAIGRQNE